jgi:hypothetical protein
MQQHFSPDEIRSTPCVFGKGQYLLAASSTGRVKLQALVETKRCLLPPLTSSIISITLAIISNLALFINYPNSYISCQSWFAAPPLPALVWLPFLCRLSLYPSSLPTSSAGPFSACTSIASTNVSVKAAVVVMAQQRELATLSSRAQVQEERLWFLSSQLVLLVALVVLVVLVVLVDLAVLAVQLQVPLTRRVECLFRDRKWFRQQAALQERQSLSLPALTKVCLSHAIFSHSFDCVFHFALAPPSFFLIQHNHVKLQLASTICSL